MKTATQMLKKINPSCPSCSPPFLKLQGFPVDHPMDLTRTLFGQADAVAPKAASGARASAHPSPTQVPARLHLPVRSHPISHFFTQQQQKFSFHCLEEH